MYIAKKELQIDDTLIFDKGAIFKNKVAIIELYPNYFDFIDVKFKDYVKYAYTFERIKTQPSFEHKDIMGNTTEELYVYNLQQEYKTDVKLLHTFYNFFFNPKLYQSQKYEEKTK